MEYRDQVLGYLYRFVHDRAAAEELTQEVFLRVYLTRNYQPAAKFRTWLFRIATNLALNWIRDRRVESGFVRLDEKPLYARAYDPPCTMPSVEEDLVSRCRLDEVRAAVQELPERHRAAVLMHKYSEMEYGEIARVSELLGTGIEVTAVPGIRIAAASAGAPGHSGSTRGVEDGYSLGPIPSVFILR